MKKLDLGKRINTCDLPVRYCQHLEYLLGGFSRMGLHLSQDPTFASKLRLLGAAEMARATVLSLFGNLSS